MRKGGKILLPPPPPSPCWKPFSVITAGTLTSREAVYADACRQTRMPKSSATMVELAMVIKLLLALCMWLLVEEFM
jgi:hypothetical protein